MSEGGDRKAVVVGGLPEEVRVELKAAKQDPDGPAN